MVANLVNNTYLFSADMEDIRITDVHEKLVFKMSSFAIRVISSMNISFVRNWEAVMTGSYCRP